MQVPVMDCDELALLRGQLAAIVDGAEDAIIGGRFGVIASWNGGAERLTGYTAGEVLGKSPLTIVPPDRHGDVAGVMARLHAGESVTGFESQVRAKSGRVIDVSLSAGLVRDAAGTIIGECVVVHDITARKRAAEAVRVSEEQFHALIDTAPDAILLYDFDENRFVTANKRAEVLFEASECDILMHGPAHYYHPVQPDGRAIDASFQEHNGRLLRGESLTFERRIVGARGTVAECEVRLSPFPSRSGRLMRASFLDITPRKAAERELARTGRALQTLSAGNRALTNAEDPASLLAQMCRIIVEVGGYRCAWVGRAQMAPPRSVEVLAVAGDGVEFLASANFTWDEGSPRGFGPAAKAIRSGSVQIVHRFGETPETAVWRDVAQEHGFASAASFPLYLEDGSGGALTIYATESDAFDADEVSLLEELANDTTFGLWTQHQRSQRERSADRLRASMERTVQALASTVELRDPYTSGHQQRVAALAAEIAREIGISESERHGIYLAATVHDIGKIRIPAAILAKPADLSAAETALIRTHARAGDEILRPIELPWPVAEIVRQHHERLDGSGYPQGLRGDAICIGARVIAVADVVEAMTAHRPYRPQLRIADALREIRDGAGTLFDPAVVDACVRVFTELRFTFPDPVQSGAAAS